MQNTIPDDVQESGMRIEGTCRHQSRHQDLGLDLHISLARLFPHPTYGYLTQQDPASTQPPQSMSHRFIRCPGSQNELFRYSRISPNPILGSTLKEVGGVGHEAPNLLREAPAPRCTEPHHRPQEVGDFVGPAGGELGHASTNQH